MGIVNYLERKYKVYIISIKSSTKISRKSAELINESVHNITIKTLVAKFSEKRT